MAGYVIRRCIGRQELNFKPGASVGLSVAGRHATPDGMCDALILLDDCWEDHTPATIEWLDGLQFHTGGPVAVKARVDDGALQQW